MKPSSSSSPEAERTTATPVIVTLTEELLRAGKALGAPQIVQGTDREPYCIVPEGYRFQPLPRADIPPLLDHIREDVELHDAESFVAYVKAFRTATTKIFATAAKLADVRPGNSGGAEFTALLDYHEGGKERKAARVGHTATYPVPMSLEFATWLAINGKAMAQMDFVSFVEANAPDIVTPDSATLQEIGLKFESTTTATFQSKVDRATGGRTLMYKEDVDAGGVGQIKVPEWMELRMPVFEGGAPYPMHARLEWRPTNGRLTIAIHLQRPHEVFRMALLHLRAEIAHDLETEILTGKVL